MILSILFGFIVGIIFGSVGFLDWSYILAILFLSVIFYFYNFFVSNEYRKILLFISLFLVFVSVGMVRVHFSDINKVSKLEKFVGKEFVFKGIVVSEPDVRETNTRLTVLVKEVSDQEENRFGEKIIISTNIYPEFKYGDEISFKARLSVPKNIDSGDGRFFNYPGYLRVRGIWYTASFVYPKLLSENNGSFVKKHLFNLKKTFTNSLNNSLPNTESALLSGLLLGSKQSLGKELLDEFSKTGVSHIVVLSGYNIAIVAGSIITFFKFLPSKFAFSFGCIGIILFTILSGGGASAVRASIMVLVALFAKKFNRDYKAGRALGFTIILMLAPNPLLLVFDPSFQLSVLATIGIVFVTPILNPYFLWVTEKLGLREIVSSTIATQLTVLPFLVYNMGLFSLVSLPVNVLILGTIPATMFFGFVTGFFGLFSFYLSFIPALPTFILLRYQLFIIHLGSGLPFSHILPPSFSLLVLIVVYLLISVFLYFLKNKTPNGVN